MVSRPISCRKSSCVPRRTGAWNTVREIRKWFNLLLVKQTKKTVFNEGWSAVLEVSFFFCFSVSVSAIFAPKRQGSFFFLKNAPSNKTSSIDGKKNNLPNNFWRHFLQDKTTHCVVSFSSWRLFLVPFLRWTAFLYESSSIFLSTLHTWMPYLTSMSVPIHLYLSSKPMLKQIKVNTEWHRR